MYFMGFATPPSMRYTFPEKITILSAWVPKQGKHNITALCG